jgi:hypothetical protein|mmetsp:Transcript_62906/g.99861  ORF Transcript_62906/g.99861 Transcript_62906/m.99861 type:complete len:87 (-) Transcript_62906:75-335(-)
MIVEACAFVQNRFHAKWIANALAFFVVFMCADGVLGLQTYSVLPCRNMAATSHIWVSASQISCIVCFSDDLICEHPSVIPLLVDFV